MLLYRHTSGRYLAVALSLKFANAFGYEICFDGRDVPDVICAAFLRESGGSVLRDVDIIHLSDGPTSGLPKAARRPSASALRDAA